jgi:c-di-GMP-binding flagellar brake protein YcgR
MAASQSFLARRTQSILSRIAPDRRRHKRLGIMLQGRFMRENKCEYPCRLLNISVGGAAVVTPVNIEVGERIVAYFEHLSGIEGVVVRVFDGGFAFTIHATQHKREKLAAQLTWLANRSAMASMEERRHERVTPPQNTAALQLAEGITVNCRVLDISMSGASVATTARPPIGSEVILGKLRAVVVRHHNEGLGVRFVDVQNPTALPHCFNRSESTTPKSREG